MEEIILKELQAITRKTRQTWSEAVSMKKLLLFLFLILSVAIVTGCTSKNTGNAVNNLAGEDEIKLYKASTCGCCEIYTQYLKRQGVDVNVATSDEIICIKEQYDIPAQMQSCHTTVIGDYFIEGHVPIEAVEKLLT